MIPFLRATMTSPPVRAICIDIAAIMGQTGVAWKKICPDEYGQNTTFLKEGEDCMFPTKTLQNSPSPVIGNQVIVRTIGLDRFHGLVRAHHEIALHFDESDHNAINPLIFLPINLDDMDKQNGPTSISNGYVSGSDLLVFEQKTGGRCARIRTTVKDTVVVAIFRSQSQLHGGVQGIYHNNDNQDDGRSYSIRIIPYQRQSIVDFVQDRKKYNGGPSSFVGIKPRPNKRHDIQADLHKPLDLCDVAVGQEVVVRWGRTGVGWRWESATTTAINQGAGVVDLKWTSTGQVTLGTRLKLYNPFCLYYTPGRTPGRAAKQLPKTKPTTTKSCTLEAVDRLVKEQICDCWNLTTNVGTRG